MAGHVEIWLWNGTLWVKALGDALGHFQVDVLTSALPAGGATAAHQVTTHGYIDGIEGYLATIASWEDAGQAVNVTISTPPNVRNHAYDGAAWQTLLVEAAALKNLRVRLYDGANGIDSVLLDLNDVPAATRGLPVKAALSVYSVAGADWKIVAAPGSIGDNDGGYNSVPVGLWLFDGTNWDRARSWGLGVQKVGRAEIDSTTIRHTATGLVVAGAHNLYWVACSPSAANALWELTDDTDGSTAVVYDHFDTDRHSEHLVFDPPMKFATGIYIKTFTSMTSLVFCYV